MTDDLQTQLEKSATFHKNLCPRQVLGVRMGVYAGCLLGFDPLRVKKRLLVIVETDGCFATGVGTSTACTIGSRNLRIEDYGKAAATFTDTHLGRSLRIVPSAEARTLAEEYAPDVPDRWEAMLEGYQRIPDHLLFTWQEVELKTTLEAIFSKPGLRTACQLCGEEIMNEREIIQDGQVLCRSCAGFGYYRLVLAQDQHPVEEQSADRTSTLHRVAQAIPIEATGLAESVPRGHNGQG